MELNKNLESANFQYKALLNPGYGSKAGSGKKSKSSKRTNRLCTSAEKINLDFPLGEAVVTEIKSSLPKKGSKHKFTAWPTHSTKEFMPESTQEVTALSY